MKFNIYLLFGQFIIIFNLCHLINGSPIIGQNIRQARAGEFSFIVSIMGLQPGSPHMGGEHFCTGVLISRKDVLTSEHCMDGERLSDVQVVFGTIDLRNGSILHPFWWQSFDQWTVAQNISDNFTMNDLCNIRLLAKVPDNLNAVRVSRLSHHELYGANVTIAGWGRNNEGVYPDIMNVANVELLHSNECDTRASRVMRSPSQLNQKMYCTVSNPFILIEPGDSGGPLLFRNRLIGVNKATCPGDTEPNNDVQMNIHMSIHFYRDYINFMKNH